MRLLLPLADQGIARAQQNLRAGCMPTAMARRDYAQAVMWYRRGPIKVMRRAARLGLMFAVGHGVPKDDSQAAKWFHKAADQGSSRAVLPWAITNGHGVLQDGLR